MRVRRPLRKSRAGYTLPMAILVLPVLLGVMGLTIDAGMLIATQRQAQHAADAAAMAAAMDLYRGASEGTALATANTFLTTATNGLSVTLVQDSGGPNSLNMPPLDPGATGSPHVGNNQYAEAIVTVAVPTMFIQVLNGFTGSQNVSARAVAGYEPVGSGEGAIVLDPTAAPGMAVTNNNSRLIVQGAVVVNSRGSGLDQYGSAVNGTYAQPAVATGGPNIVPAPIVAAQLQVVGGVDTPTNVRYYDSAFGPTDWYDTSNTDLPIFARAPLTPDPLKDLVTPTTSNGVPDIYPDKTGADLGTPQDINIGNNETVTLVPGIYHQIRITGGTVTMQPGIYVVGPYQGQGNPPPEFTITGGTVTANGVMIYNTGNNYDKATGLPDANDQTAGQLDPWDGYSLPPNNPGATFGGITINGGNVTMTPIGDTNSPFYGMMFYQRRWNTSSANIQGNSSDLQLGPATPSSTNPAGTLYAKWANFQLAGTGRFNSQFVVGSMSVSGGAVVTINSGGKSFGRANVVFLVE